MRLLPIAAIFAAGLCYASSVLVLKNGNGDELRLLDTPCSHGETLGQLTQEWRPRFKNARILNSKGHIRFFGCWIKHDEETAFILLEDGASLAIPLAAFTDPTI